jgi:hypothetical protein
VKQKKKKKKQTDKSAFSHLLEEVEKDKKKARIFYSVVISLMVIALLTFLIFSPLQVPVFSQIGDRILGREDVGKEGIEEEKIEEEEVLQEEEPEEEGEVGEKEEDKPKESSSSRNLSTSTENNTDCSSDSISTYRDNFCEIVNTQSDISAAAGWGEKLNKCGVSFSIQECYVTTPAPAPEPEPEPEAPKFSCAEETMQSYVNTMCSNYVYIGEAEAIISPSANLESYDTCVRSSCYLVAEYPDLLMECEAECLSSVNKNITKYEGYIQDYNSNIQYYSNLLMSCGWTMSEVHEVKQILLKECQY